MRNQTFRREQVGRLCLHRQLQTLKASPGDLIRGVVSILGIKLVHYDFECRDSIRLRSQSVSRAANGNSIERTVVCAKITFN